MKTIIIVLIAVLMLGCDKRFDYFEANNQDPVIPLSAQLNAWSTEGAYTTMLIDSVKNTTNYQIALSNWDDRSEFLKIMVSKPLYGKILDGSGEEIIYDQFFDLEYNYWTYLYVVESNGQENISFTSKDLYDKVGISTLKLLVFDNLPPKIESLVVTEVDNLSPLEYNFDASFSRDLDSKYGGEIVAFEFVVGADTLFTPQSSIDYIFSEPGVYTVSVKALDNENSWSPVLSVGGLIVE